MKTASAKNKGRTLQKYVRDYLRNLCKNVLTPEDIESRPMGSQGTDIILSPAAQKIIPYSIECKNQESLNIWKAIEQAQQNTKQGRIPLVVFKRNNSEVYACLKLSDLLK